MGRIHASCEDAVFASGDARTSVVRPARILALQIERAEQATGVEPAEVDHHVAGNGKRIGFRPGGGIALPAVLHARHDSQRGDAGKRDPE